MKKIKSYFIVSISVSALSFPLQGLAFSTNNSNSKSDAYTQDFSLSLSSGGLSAKIENISIGAVLKRFSNIAGVDITISEARAQELISVDFSGLPLQKGIQRILGENYTLVYDNSGSQKLTDIRIVNNFSISNTVAGKAWIRFSPEIDFEEIQQNRDVLEKLVSFGKLPNNAINVESKVLVNLALNDANIQVRQLALLALAKQAGKKAVKQVLQQSVENNGNLEVQSLAQSLLKQMDNDNTNDKLVMASAFKYPLPVYSSATSNAPAQTEVSNNSTSILKGSDVATLNQDGATTDLPENVVAKNDNEPQQQNDQKKNQEDKNQTEAEQQQKNHEKGGDKKSEDEVQPVKDKEKNKEEPVDPQKSFRQKLGEADPQDILPILTEGIRDGLQIDVTTLEQYASDDYPVELRQTAIEEIVDQLGYQEGYEYLKQKIADEPGPEMAEFIKAVGVQFINDAKWITKKTFDRSPFQ